MAFRMQASVPELTDVSGEPQSVLDLYGPEVKQPGTYAANCLLARRMLERGVRMGNFGEVKNSRIGAGSFAVVPSELDPQIGETYRDEMVGAEHTFIIGLGNDEIGYQLPAPKWDDSCHACAPFILAGVPQFCPLFPNIDCNTVFQNNAGQEVDPAVGGAIVPLIDALHDGQ